MISWRILGGDVREMVQQLPDQSVQTVVTSPPYWGLRDYGTATWEGGDPECEHDQRRRERDPDSKSATNAGASRDGLAWKSHCRKCGARRIDNQIGLEPSPDAYVSNLVQVFREVRRVLRDDGTVWLNLGDSYVSNGRYESDRSTYVGELSKYDHRDPRPAARALGLKPKDLCGIPWRVAFALQADGWYLRSDIIWSKAAPMPESVFDRPTKSHEYIFLLSKRARYYYDSAAIAEEVQGDRAPSRAKWSGAGRLELRGTGKTTALRRIAINGAFGILVRSHLLTGQKPSVRSVWHRVTPTVTRSAQRLQIVQCMGIRLLWLPRLFMVNV